MCRLIRSSSLKHCSTTVFKGNKNSNNKKIRVGFFYNLSKSNKYEFGLLEVAQLTSIQWWTKN